MPSYKQFENEIFIGPQPTEQDLAEAKQQGVHTVIDMRMLSETTNPNAQLVKNSGLNYVNIPVDKAALSVQQIDEFDAAIKQVDGPVLLHCATGVRAAMLLALSRARQNGWTSERTFQEADAMGYDLQSMPNFATFVRQTTEK